jgi:hypothetical protein
LEKHGLDFASLRHEFFLGAVIIPARHGRLKAMGQSSFGLLSVVFAPLGSEGLAVISMRSASKREKELLR